MKNQNTKASNPAKTKNMSVWKLIDGEYDGMIETSAAKKKTKAEEKPKYVTECKVEAKRGFDALKFASGNEVAKSQLSESALMCAEEIQKPGAEKTLLKEIDRMCSNLSREDYEELKKYAGKLRIAQTAKNAIISIEEGGKIDGYAKKVLQRKKDVLDKEIATAQQRLRVIKGKYPKIFPPRFPNACNDAIDEMM